MRTLSQILADTAGTLEPPDLARISERLAGLVRYGHELGAAHGDIDLDTVLVDRHGGDWVVQLEQPRARPDASSADPDPSEDILALGRVVERLSQALNPYAAVAPSFAAAVRSMTSPVAAERPSAAQVEVYFGEDFLTSSGDAEQGEPPAPGGPPEEPADPELATPQEQSAPPSPSREDEEGKEDEEFGYAPSPVTVPRPAETALLAQEDEPAWVPTLFADQAPEDPAEQDDESRPEVLATTRPRRSGRAAVVVSSLVLALGLGSLGYVVWRTVAPQADDTAVAVPDTAPGVEATEAEPTDPEEPSTAQEQSTEAGDSTTVESDILSTEEEASSTVDDTAEPLGDHTSSSWAGSGWDTQALDDAYCRDGSHFIGLAETDTYRGVICSTGFGYAYRGLNTSQNATILSAAQPTAEGWEAFGTGGVTYEFDEHTFTIRDGDGSVLDKEPVNLWLTPDQEPFRPGDLGLDQPISYPACDGSGVVLHSSHMNPATNARTVQEALDDIPGSFYVRTDLSCDNFNRPSATTRSNGNYIYSVLTYGGDTQAGLCTSIRAAGEGAYGYFLAEGVPPGQIITCE